MKKNKYSGHTPPPWSEDDGNVFGGSLRGDKFGRSMILFTEHTAAPEMEPPFPQQAANIALVEDSPMLLRLGEKMRALLEGECDDPLYADGAPCGKCRKCKMLAAWDKLTSPPGDK